MKVTKTKAEVFTPVIINITLESESEYRVFYELMGKVCSVPAFLYNDDYEIDRSILTEVMKSTFKVL